jgi:hypothetical protein
VAQSSNTTASNGQINLSGDFTIFFYSQHNVLNKSGKIVMESFEISNGSLNTSSFFQFWNIIAGTNSATREKMFPIYEESQK